MLKKKINLNWMDLLQFSFKKDPKKTAFKMPKIYKVDDKISHLVKKLTN